MSKPLLPEITSDEALEHFMDGDLSLYIQRDTVRSMPFSFGPSFEDLPKTEDVHLRLSQPLLEAIRQQAARQGMGYQKYIRRTMEAALQQEVPGG